MGWLEKVPKGVFPPFVVFWSARTEGDQWDASVLTVKGHLNLKTYIVYKVAGRGKYKYEYHRDQGD